MHQICLDKKTRQLDVRGHFILCRAVHFSLGFGIGPKRSNRFLEQDCLLFSRLSITLARIRVRIVSADSTLSFPLTKHDMITVFQSNLDSPGITKIGSPMWQAKADTELTLSALPATGQSKLTMTNLG